MNNTNGSIDRLAIPLILVSLPLTFMDLLLPMYTMSLGYTPVQITGLFSIFSFFLVLMRLYVGRISDRYGRKTVLIAGLLLYALSYLLYSYSKDIGHLYTARVFQSIAGVCLSISCFSMVADLNNNLGHNYGKIGGYEEKGGLVGVALCFIIFNYSDFMDGWSYIFKICSAAALISTIYSIIFIKNVKYDYTNTKFNFNFLKQNILILNLIIKIFTSIVSSIFVLYIANKFNSDLLETGIAFLIPAVVIAFAYEKLGKISDTIGRYRAVKTSLIMLVLCLIVLTAIKNIYTFGIFWTVYCIAVVLLDISLKGMFSSDIMESRGTAIGKYTMAGNIGTIIGPVAAGLLFQNNIALPFIVSSAAFAVMLLTMNKWFNVLSVKKS
ncbi:MULTISPECIES: MFS transporter [unclassified Sedimentibacter]|uniref:MFS transporter n=1 Tax=unclassified Sedimentibacter TaxID=2649220 RepID=UPI0027E0E669|nr:MFS transporter [Sedimentibacter sp. MB35-C1]WMJ76202.1 MFS transporter [Sedimentibacter sp. MB35-C1]